MPLVFSHAPLCAELLKEQWQLFLQLPDAQLPCDASLERLKALVKSDRALVLQAITGAPLSCPTNHDVSAVVNDLVRSSLCWLTVLSLIHFAYLLYAYLLCLFAVSGLLCTSHGCLPLVAVCDSGWLSS